ncbi:sigma-70 family RNA polymerase sigma factor [Planctomycetales bacterium ZRK34]|nr:sigma-70 family RNA polymerase sigma factor [Planctomycetales bacterium ZRK34]
MPAFLSQSFQRLCRQLAFAPPARRRLQIDNAEQLYWQIDPDRNYPLDFLVFRITGYRPDTSDGTTLVGAAARRDLLLLVDELSKTLDERFSDYDPRPLDQPAVCDKLNVSAKTITRYRRQGLFARRLIWPDGKRRLAFLPQSVDRFTESRRDKLQQAARFNRIDEPTRHQIITRARRIASRVQVTPFAVAEHLSKKFDRSTETIRLLLLAHDKRDPRVAIFPDHTPPLTAKQQRIIHRAYHRGISVARLARRFNKSRTAVYRAINHRRAAAILQLDIRYVANPVFQRADADEVILAPAAAPESTTAAIAAISATAPPSLESLPLLSKLTDQPPLSPQQEQTLFVRYNYLKFRAAERRNTLDRYDPNSGILDEIETHLRRAVAIKHQLVRANMRLVVSVARKHLTGSHRSDRLNLPDLVGDGSIVLLEAVETFDPARGNRFSTYLTWALMRRFAQSTATVTAAPRQSGLEYWPAAMNPAIAAVEQAEQVAATLERLLARLDDRERFIITRHFGLTDPAADDDAESSDLAAQPLSRVAEQLGISAERARQIEHRAMQKLRRAATAQGLSLNPGDAPSPP